jgi:hypothetical protein
MLESAWRIHVSKRWARVAIVDVDLLSIESWISNMGAKGAGTTTILRAYGVLSGILTDAVKAKRLVALERTSQLHIWQKKAWRWRRDLNPMRMCSPGTKMRAQAANLVHRTSPRFTAFLGEVWAKCGQARCRPNCWSVEIDVTGFVAQTSPSMPVPPVRTSVEGRSTDCGQRWRGFSSQSGDRHADGTPQHPRSAVPSCS